VETARVLDGELSARTMTTTCLRMHELVIQCTITR
jgi:hypothetical protein